MTNPAALALSSALLLFTSAYYLFTRRKPILQARQFPDDQVHSIPMLEQSFPATEIYIDSCLAVAGQLDPSRLKDALSALVKRWPILGARLALNADGFFEYHIPKEHNVSRPPFLFTSGKHDSPAPPLPERSGHLQPPTLEFIHLFRHASAPVTPRDVIARPDMPTLHVNINVYSDITLVGFRYPHILVDIPGLAVILRGWLSALEGRVSELPHLSNPVMDGLANPYPKTPSELEKFRRDMKSSLTIWSTWDKLRVYIPMVKEFIVHKKEAYHSLFLPKKLIHNLREHAMKELGGQC